MDPFMYILSLILVSVSTLLFKDILDEKKVVSKKDFPRSIFFNEDDKEKFFFAYNLMTFLDDLVSKDLSNQEMKIAVDQWMSNFSQTSVGFYLIDLMKGNAGIPPEEYFMDCLDKEDLKVLKDRSKINDLIRYIIETNLNVKD